MISGQSPRREWRENPDGRTRTIEEALLIVEELGMRIPEDVAFYLDELGELDQETTARGPRVDKLAGEKVHWSDLVHDLTGKVPFRIWPGLLNSDEAIVAVIAHELYEIETLRPYLEEGSLSIDDFIAHTEPGRAGNCHDRAWDVAGRDGRSDEKGGDVTVNKLLAMYERGVIVANELVWDCLCLIDPADPSLILEVLPESILTRMLELTDQFRPGRLVTNFGPLPTLDQVEAARRWIENSARVEPARSLERVSPAETRGDPQIPARGHVLGASRDFNVGLRLSW